MSLIRDYAEGDSRAHEAMQDAEPPNEEICTEDHQNFAECESCPICNPEE